MAFTFSNANIRENQIVFIYEECALSGVRKIAGKVRDDIGKVFGSKPIGVEYENFADTAAFYSHPVFFGTVGQSTLLDKLSASGAVDLFKVAAEREAYSLNVVDDLCFEGFSFESAIVIAGSDKRGTIYGLFKLSEMLGVSPFVDWLDVAPMKLEKFVLTPDDSVISRSPSVRYRGFFINDEWPAFGNFCQKNFGGFTAKMYEHVFELLLRLKGNYLWPAMWSSVFYEDGPGEAAADLADELGVVMGTSHHEPCLRQGEEYSHVRGPGSEYGDAWSFVTNREGITKFWRDGIAARNKYENVYTVGMRGEADSAILGREATLADNIELLRDVITTQNRLISEGTGRSVDEVPRLLALYKEVEPFYYGDKNTKGLIGDPLLDGITLLLCDDNHGNLRTVPTGDMRDHKGGYGMYYHLDYHGEPVSYEWFNTSYLPKIWEQMTTAYDFGIKELWIVNVGDIFTNEYPLAFFLDLAYDFDKWGTSDPDSSSHYTKRFVDQNFPRLSEDDRKVICDLLKGYTKITHCRRTEAMNDGIYAPFAYGESRQLLEKIELLMSDAQDMYKRMPEECRFAFYELVYLPLTATLNVQKMWLLTGLNHAYAKMGSTVANSLAEDIRQCIKKDRKLTEKLHEIHKGKWYGMGLSEHIGFKNWCEEECCYPIVHTFEPANKPRLIVTIPSTGEHTEGGFWSGRTLTLPDALDPLVCGGYIELSTASDQKVSCTVTCDDDFIDIIKPPKNVKSGQIQKVFIFVDRMKITDSQFKTGTVYVASEDRKVTIRVPVSAPGSFEGIPENTYIYCGEDDSDCMSYISIEAANYVRKNDTEKGAFCVINGYGKTESAIKAYPQNVIFSKDDAPTVTYGCMLKKSGKYTLRVYTNPSNPAFCDNELKFFVDTGTEHKEVNMIPEGFAIGDGQEFWGEGVLSNIRQKDITLDLKEGINEITIGALSPGFVLEKLVIRPEGKEPAYSYLGPAQTFRVI